MQVLSCTSAGILVSISGLLLRSQSLISGGRSPNFESRDPNVESSDVSTELVPVVVLLLIFLSVPVIMAMGLAAMLKFKRATSQPGEHHGHGTAMEASCFNTCADVRLCFTPLMQRWQKWRGRKVADSNQEEKAAAVLASAAILYSRQRSRQ